MAIELQNKTNVAAPDTDYEFGRIVDDTGVGDGTPVDVQVYGDFHQFFAKLAALAGITYNNQPENKTNGYQYITALQTVINPAFTNSGIVYTNTGADVWGDKGSPYFGAGYQVNRNTVRLCGVVHNSSLTGASSQFIMTLPTAARPSSTVKVAAWNADSGSFIQLTIASDGTVRTSVTAASDVFLDGISFRIN